MRNYVVFYLTALKNSFASRMAYRADFLFSSFMILVTELLIPFITLLIYGTGAAFPGWSVYEVLLLQGIFMVSRGVAGLLFFGLVWNTLDRVREGTYDILLIKPASVLFMSIATNFEPDSIGTVVGGLATCLFSVSRLKGLDLSNIPVFLLLFAMSLVMLFSLAMIMAGSVFKWVGNSRVYEIFDSVVSFGNFPRSIFSRAFQTIISYVIPIAAIGFLPASALLGKKAEGIPASMLICIVFLAFSLYYWKSMLARYTSAGG